MEEPKRGRGRPPSENPRSKFVQIRARPEWVEWLRSVANQADMEVADIIGEAVASWAKRRQLPPPPDR
jgi:hypothetical protein